MKFGKVLIADDEAEIRELLRLYLEKEGYDIVEAVNGEEALRILQEDSGIGIVLLDIMMPKIDGFHVLKRIREERNLPVVILSAKTEDSDKILGLDLGADDYIAKPFRPRELISRIHSVLRRYGKVQSVLEYEDVRVDVLNGTVRKGGQEVLLSALEYRLLLIFLGNQGTVLTRNRLLEEIWDVAGEFVNDNTLTVYIKRLREKIETDIQEPRIIRTVRGIGYRCG